MDKSNNKAGRQISIWLAVGIFMVLIQILLGGITRLTGSGLSITEWKPLMGAFPPISKADWEHSFEQYRQIAQFKKLNNNFNLTDFQHLFFWEWLHREWARLMGLVFIIPFLVFLWQKKFSIKIKWQLAGVFLLGAIQGLAGWLMVKSGLNDTDVSVNHIRLAIHFMLALVLLVYLFWMFLTIRIKLKPGLGTKGFCNLTLTIILLMAIQFVYGAFMAGTHAALYAPTWPDINGAFLQVSPDVKGNFLHKIADDPLLIQFIHRAFAYLLITLLLIWFLIGRQLSRIRNFALLAVTLQAFLGVVCLLNAGTPVYIWLAVLHQLNGIVLLLIMVTALYWSNGRVISKKSKIEQSCL